MLCRLRRLRNSPDFVSGRNGEYLAAFGDGGKRTSRAAPFDSRLPLHIFEHLPEMIAKALRPHVVLPAVTERVGEYSGDLSV